MVGYANLTGSSETMGNRHALTIELPESLYATLTRAAASRGKNLMTFAREAIMERARGIAEAELVAAYDALADDAEESDVEPLFSAQAEIVTE